MLRDGLCCGMHGNLCHLAGDVTGPCCSECPLLAGHIEIVGYRRDAEQAPPGTSLPEVLSTVDQIATDERTAAKADAEALPDEVFDAGVRALLQCPDVPNHAHITMASLRQMVREVAPFAAVRAALQVAFTAGVKHGLDLGDGITEDAIARRVDAEVDLLLERNLCTAERQRVLADLLDSHPYFADILSTAPYDRANQVQAIVEAVGELLGVDGC